MSKETFISEYKILKKLSETSMTVTYEAENSDNLKVIIKLLKTERTSSSQMARFKQEYAQIKKMNIDGVVEIKNVIDYEDNIAVIMEYFPSVSLKKIVIDSKIDLNTFIDIAIKLASILGELHKRNIVHEGIRSSSILVGNDGTIKLTDFNILKTFTHSNEEIFNYPDIVNEFIHYMSPEQTGRMNRSVDYRSDIYSIGIIFYEMLTGQTPFNSGELMEIVHAHIAKTPMSPEKHNPLTTPMISKIVLKMLAKNPEDRYQNSLGVMSDLLNCKNQLEKTETIKDFELGQNDISIKFSMPQQIYGRDLEIKQLLEVFERMINFEQSEMIFISGNSGIGKSTLINEIRIPVITEHGYFITGKYDKFRKNVPYSSIIQAFQGLVKQLLAAGPEQMEVWKKRMLKALGRNGKVITNIIPDIEMILGKQPEVPELNPEESQNRLHMIFMNFILALPSVEHPLVLFLDDLQWADLASLELIKMIMQKADSRFLLLIGAFRENEIDESDFFKSILQNTRNANIRIKHISLPPLDIQTVNQILSNLLRCEETKSHNLATVVQQKTNGNPFFIGRFLKTLYDNEILQLNPCKGWNWNLEEIKKIQVTDNVIELMIEKIFDMPKSSSEILKIASCVGNRFEWEMISKLMNTSVNSIIFDIINIVRAEFVYSKGNMCHFSHDKIQEAAYSLVTMEEKEKFHYLIGHNMLVDTLEKELFDKIFYIVNQLNLGKNKIHTRSEQIRLAELNLIAARKAKTSVAYQSAQNYLEKSIKILGPHCWQEQYQLSLETYTEAADIAYLNRNPEQMEQFSKVVLENGKNILDKVGIYETKIRESLAKNKPLATIKTGLEILKLLGINITPNPGKIHIIFGFIKTKLALRRKTTTKLLNLPRLTNRHLKAALNITPHLITSSYFAAPNLLPMIVFKIIRLSIKHGNSINTPQAYACYGFALCSMGMIKEGNKFGKLAIDLANKMQLTPQLAKVTFLYNAFIYHWENHAKNTILPLKRTFQRSLEIGDFEFASHSIMVYLYHIYYFPGNLEDYILELEKYENTVKELKQRFDFFMIKQHRQLALYLAGKNDCIDGFLAGDAYNEKEMLPIHEKDGDQTSIYTLYCMKYALSYFSYNYLSALEHVTKAENLQEASIGSMSVCPLYFFSSLIRVALIPSMPEKQKAFISKIRKNQKKLKMFSHHSPMNCLHKYQLLEASLAAIEGKFQKACQLFNKSIKNARKNKYINDEAIACELAARFYLENDFDNIAAVHMSDAYNAYTKWGLKIKQEQLKRDFPELLNRKNSNNSTFSLINGPDKLDLTTIMKASCTISSEVKLDRLLSRILDITIENAGATKGHIILKKRNKWFVESERFVGKQNPEKQHSLPLEKSAETLSVGIVQYVIKTTETVVLENASNEGNFTNDLYVLKNRAKSILCTTIANYGKLIGIIYLENDLTTNAFSLERIKILDVLCSQAAVSLENARLYEEMNTAHSKLVEQEKIRTAFFHNTSHELRTPLNGIMGLCQIMVDQDKNQFKRESKQSVIKIAHLAESLKIQVNTILDLAKLRKRELKLTLNLIDLNELATECEHLAHGLRGNRNEFEFKIIKSWENQEKPTIIADREKLATIIRNLIGNAFKYTLTPTKNQTDAKIKMEFILQKNDSELLLRCSDTGIGIPEDQLKHIFDEFKQVESDSRRSFEGTGLGLSLVHKLVELMNGSIDVKSKLGEGSTFSIMIPSKNKTNIELHLSDYKTENEYTFMTKIKEQKNTNSPKNTLSTNIPFGGYQILVVDDNEINVEVAAGILQASGFNINTAFGGREALKQIEINKPDLVLLDLMMPDFSGEDVLKEIQNDDSKKDIPVILITARASNEDRIWGLKIGADDYLAKPVIAEELVLRVKAVLTRRELTKKVISTEETMIRQEKMAQIGMMLNDLSHELKNLNVLAISGFSETRKSVNVLHKKYTEIHPKWPEILEGFFKNGVTQKIKRNRKKILELPNRDNPRLKRLHSLFSNLDVNDDILSVVWEKLKNSSPEEIDIIFNLIVVTRFVSSTNRSSEKSMTILTSVLDYSRESDQKEDTDISSVVNSCIFLLEKKFNELPLEPECNLDENLLVTANTSDMHQVILNLLSNAHDSLAESNQKEKEIKVSCEAEDDNLILLVEDNGENGIPEQIQTKIFDRNFSTKGEKGSGIGLFVSSQLAKKNNGFLKVHSIPGKTIFKLGLQKK